MNLHTITVLFVLVGLALMLFCVVSAEVCYRKVTRYLEQQAVASGRDQEGGQQSAAGQS